MIHCIESSFLLSLLAHNKKRLLFQTEQFDRMTIASTQFGVLFTSVARHHFTFHKLQFLCSFIKLDALGVRFT